MRLIRLGSCIRRHNHSKPNFCIIFGDLLIALDAKSKAPPTPIATFTASNLNKLR